MKRPSAGDLKRLFDRAPAIIAAWTAKFGRSPSLESDCPKKGLSVLAKARRLEALEVDASAAAVVVPAVVHSRHAAAVFAVKEEPPLYCRGCGRPSDYCSCKKAAAKAGSGDAEVDAMVSSFAALPPAEQAAIAEQVAEGLAAAAAASDAAGEESPPLKGKARAAAAWQREFGGLSAGLSALPTPAEAKLARAKLTGRQKAAAAINEQMGVRDIRNMPDRRGLVDAPAAVFSRQLGVEYKGAPPPRQVADFPKLTGRELAVAVMTKQAGGNPSTEPATRYRPDSARGGRARAARGFQSQFKISGSSRAPR